MPHYLILAQSETTASALNVWLNLLGSEELTDDNPRMIIHDLPLTRGIIASVDAYESLVRRIEYVAKGSERAIPFNELVVLVDSTRPDELNAVDDSSWDNILAMLILTFPEIRWHFGVIAGTSNNEDSTSFPSKCHKLFALFGVPRDSLLDPTRLRQWIRERTNLASYVTNKVSLPIRRLRVAAIDDEKDYAILHGYTAYRFGYVADTVTSWSLMKRLFSNKGQSHGYSILLEDMSLKFPDKKAAVHLLSLEKRATHCPQLDSPSYFGGENSDHRIIITTGQTGMEDEDTLIKNKRYLKRKLIGRYGLVFKPTGGMFDLWDEAGLLQRTVASPLNKIKYHLTTICNWIFLSPNNGAPPQQKGNVTEFIGLEPSKDGEICGHGTSGKLFLVADTLISRGENLLEGASSVSRSIQGAVLSTDALELTEGKTPTTALRALNLKHHFEVLAESRFVGVEMHLQIRTRLEEIQKDVKNICETFSLEHRQSASLNAEIAILTTMVRVLRKNAKFDEEQTCMYRLRKLHYTLWKNKFGKAMGTCIHYIVDMPFYYVNWLLSSFPIFVLMIWGWLVGLSIFFSYVIPIVPGEAFIQRLVRGVEASLSSFFSIGVPFYNGMPNSGISTSGLAIVTCVAIVSGCIHLGVFIAHLYSLLSRK